MRKQEELKLSAHLAISDMLGQKTNLLRRLKDLVDFWFIYEELEDKSAPRRPDSDRILYEGEKSDLRSPQCLSGLP